MKSVALTLLLLGALAVVKAEKTAFEDTLIDSKEVTLYASAVYDAVLTTSFYGPEQREPGQPSLPIGGYTTAGSISYAYGITFYSDLKLTVKLELFEAYFVQWEFIFLPLVFTPAALKISWNRPWFSRFGYTAVN